jgi:multiple sugar transport system substrate-binding protein
MRKPITLAVAAAALALWQGGLQPAKAATEIVYWDFIQPGDKSPRGEALKRNIEAFQAKYPDIKVKVEVLAPALIDSHLIQGASAGRSPDVVRVLGNYLARHVAAGSIQPLDKYVSNVDKADWVTPWDGTILSGKKFALPLEQRFTTLMYRKDVLAKNGVSVPKTWDEVCASGGKINASNVMGYGLGLSQSDSANILLELTENVVLDAGTKLFDDSGKAIFDNEAGLKFFKLVNRLVKDCKATTPAIVEITSNSLGEGLAAGTIAMAQHGTHRFKAFQAQGAGDNLGWAPPPSFTAGKEPRVHAFGWTLTMGAHTKNADAAWKFIEFMTSPEAQLNVAMGGELPVRRSVYKDPWFQKPEATFIREAAEYLQKNGVANKYPENWFNFGQILSQNMQAMILRGVTPEQALKNTVATYNAQN